jgi:hypothetical protein
MDIYIYMNIIIFFNLFKIKVSNIINYKYFSLSLIGKISVL